MNKRAFLIMGNGNTGNRHITNLFLKNDCWGDRVGHSNRWACRLDNDEWPDFETNIAWRTHNFGISGLHPSRVGKTSTTSIFDMVKKCVENGYEPTIIGIYRDITLTSYGAVKRGHRALPEEAGKKLKSEEQFRQEEGAMQKKLIKDYSELFTSLNKLQQEYTTFVVDYSAYIRNPILYVRMMSHEINYPLKNIQVNKNSDGKHYERYK